MPPTMPPPAAHDRVDIFRFDRTEYRSEGPRPGVITGVNDDGTTSVFVYTVPGLPTPTLEDLATVPIVDGEQLPESVRQSGGYYARRVGSLGIDTDSVKRRIDELAAATNETSRRLDETRQALSEKGRWENISKRLASIESKLRAQLNGQPVGPTAAEPDEAGPDIGDETDAAVPASS